MTRLRLPPGQNLIRDAARWPVVGERAPRDDPAPWTVTVGGLVSRPATYDLATLRALGWETRRLDIHCVTRWSQFDRRFAGVPLAALIDATGPAPEAAWVWLEARSARGHATSLPIEVARGCLIAFEAEGAPLGPEHGGPARVIAPGKYFFKSLKWLERVELMAENRLGWWESGPGYHDGADPWREQRFVTGAIRPALRARLLGRRDLRGRELLGLDLSRAALAGLDARGAILRDARLRAADLRAADFTGANLSNADLVRADLRAARLRGADLEGARLDGADLRGADLTDASLFGASLFGPHGAARLDPAALSPAQVAALADDQAAALRRG